MYRFLATQFRLEKNFWLFEYLWAVFREIRFPDDFIKSTVPLNINGLLTEAFKASRGFKQGCPLSTPLHILAISPFRNRWSPDECIKSCSCLCWQCYSYNYRSECNEYVEASGTRPGEDWRSVDQPGPEHNNH